MESGKFASQISAALTWNIEVTDTDGSAAVFAPVTSLANLDLELYDSTGTFLGSVLDSSLSTAYNHEHIFFEGLGSGTYTFVISGDAATDFGFAWRITAIPEPSSGLILGIVGAFSVRFRRRRSANV